MTKKQKVEELIDLVRVEKEQRGLNYRELSNETGVSNQSLMHWLNYHFYPGLLPFVKVMDKLGYEIVAVKKT